MRQKLLLITGWIIFTILPVLMFAQNKTVTGQVTERKNLPVSGATIAVKNSNQAVSSDANGKFSLSVPGNAVLIITAAGYKTQTIKAADASDLQIKLSEDVARLD